MTTTYTKSLTTDFAGNLYTTQFQDEINIDSNIVPNCIAVLNEADNVNIIFDSTLSTGEQTTLTSLVSSHAPLSTPYIISTVINAGETYICNHFRDTTYSRAVIIKEQTTDTYDETKFTFNNTLTSDYTISNPTDGQLNPTSFLMIGTGFQEGSNIAATGTASASSFTQPASNAIDNNVGTFWYNNRNSELAVGSWWKIDFAEIKAIYGIEVVWYSTTYYSTDISIEYSNDNTNWSLGLRDQTITYTGSGQTTGTYKFASFSSPIFARYFRLTCNVSNNYNYFIMKEIRFFNADSSGFSTISNTTLNNIKTNRQIDTEIWNSINSCSINGTYPTGTNTNILLSFDDQTTWKYWNGSAWTTSTLGNIATTSMSNTTFNALTDANFQSTNGLNSSTKTLDIAVNIGTTNAALSPIISGFTFNLTTQILKEQISDSSTRIRYLTSSKTEIKNISKNNKTFDITIIPSLL